MAHKTNTPDDYTIVGTFGVKKALFKKYNECYLKIISLLSAGKPVPNALVRIYFTIFQDMEWVEADKARKEREIKQKEVVDKVLDYFSKHDLYQFSGKSLQASSHFDILLYLSRKENHTTAVQVYQDYSFRAMIETCVQSYLMISAHMDMTKDECIVFFFEVICDYLTKYLPQQELKEYKPYKRKVISAYLTMCVGIRLVDISKTKIGNPQLFQATRNAFKVKKKGLGFPKP